MKQFPNEKHLCSWAGVAPGNCKSAGRDLGGKINHGNRWLKGVLTECAWAASRSKEGYLRDKFWRLAVKSRNTAIVAVAHSILILVYGVLSRAQPYQEQRDLPSQERQRMRLIRHHIRRLGRLGIKLRVSSRKSTCKHPQVYDATLAT